jgi:hypothetical protein
MRLSRLPLSILAFLLFRAQGLYLAITLAFAIASVVTVQAQQIDPTDPTFETGIKQFGSYQGGQIDTISLLQGGFTVDIPLISYPQRGGKLKLLLSCGKN